MNNPKVSIVVPIYGVEKYIEKCAISLFEQTFTNIEYFFVDDCTKDQSIEILKEVVRRYPNRKAAIQIIRHDKNRGLSAARNTGVEACTGDYILHVDSDDFIEKGTVEVCVQKAIETNADIVLFGTNYIYKNLTRTILPDSIPDDLVSFRNEMIMGDVQHSVWGKLFKRNIYVKNDVKAIEGLHQGEDFAVVARLVYYAEKVAVVRMALYNYLVKTNIYSFNEKILRDVYCSWQVVHDFYKLQKDYESYADALRLRLLSFYSWQICSWQNSCYKDKSGVNLIKKYFPRSIKISGLSFRKRIVIFLFEKGWYYLLHLYILFSRKVQELLSRRGKDINNT